MLPHTRKPQGLFGPNLWPRAMVRDNVSGWYCHQNRLQPDGGILSWQKQRYKHHDMHDARHGMRKRENDLNCRPKSIHFESV
jgi:hypothetical protein